MMDRSLNVLALQPYDGGSHRAFLAGWKRHSRHRWRVLSLPARHWKWRMRQAAVAFQADLPLEDFLPDCCLTTDMLNLSELRGMLAKRGVLQHVPWLLYVHENQFAYPDRHSSPASHDRDLHFAMTNLISVASADVCWFNSEFNRRSMLDGYLAQQRHWPDALPGMAASLNDARVFHPGIDSPPLRRVKEARRRRLQRRQECKPLRIVWAARWEHDKGPDLLLQLLSLLNDSGLDYQISIIGEQFRQIPDEFESIRQLVSDRLLKWGFLPSRDDYWDTLLDSDVFLSTAWHEFFGLAAAEAIASGCLPLLPARLAYPELIQIARLATFDEHSSQPFLYDSVEEAVRRLAAWSAGAPMSVWTDAQFAGAIRFGRELGWDERAQAMDLALDQLVESA